MNKILLRNATVLVEKAIEVISLGIKGLNGLCEDLSPIDQETGDVIQKLLELQELGITALSKQLAELRLKSLIDLEGVSASTDCECGHECLELSNGNWYCMGCKNTFEGSDTDEEEI